MHRRQRSRPTWFAACAAGVLCLASGIVGADAAIARPQPETLSTAVRASCPVAAADRLPTVTDRIGPLRTFSADELQRLVDLTSAAAVSVATPPPIFGDPVADARIRQLAEARGYRPRSDVGISGLVGVDGRVLESATASAWRSMKAGAAAEGISLTLSSGYRSTARQRSIFLGKLAALGLSASTVRAGRSDAAIESVLRFSSIPGYSATTRPTRSTYSAQGMAPRASDDRQRSRGSRPTTTPTRSASGSSRAIRRVPGPRVPTRSRGSTCSSGSLQCRTVLRWVGSMSSGSAPAGSRWSANRSTTMTAFSCTSTIEWSSR